MKIKHAGISKQFFAVLLILAMLLTMVPMQAFGATVKPYEIGMVGYADNRTKIAGKYFYCSGTAVTKPESLYVSSTAKGKAVRLSTQGAKGVSYITVITNGSRVYYVYTNSKRQPMIYSKTTAGKSMISYPATKGKAKEHFELVGIYNKNLYYAAIPYNSTSAYYTLKCLNLTTKKVTTAVKIFEPFCRVGFDNRTGKRVDGRYAYGYTGSNQNNTVIYDCKLKKAKTMKGIHLDEVIDSKIYCRTNMKPNAITTLNRYDANGTNPKALFKGKCFAIEKITPTYFKYCVQKTDGSYNYDYYKFTFGSSPETGIKKPISSEEYYK